MTRYMIRCSWIAETLGLSIREPNMNPILVLIMYVLGGLAVLGMLGAGLFLIVGSLIAGEFDFEFIGFMAMAILGLGWFARRMFRGARDMKTEIVNEIHSENS